MGAGGWEGEGNGNGMLNKIILKIKIKKLCVGLSSIYSMAAY